jgi:hypothetical protein
LIISTSHLPNVSATFGALIKLGTDQWDRVFKEYLQQRNSIKVAPVDHEQPLAMFLPDGWMMSILLPVSSDQLSIHLERYNSLSPIPSWASLFTWLPFQTALLA